MNFETLRKILAPLSRSVRGMITRGVIAEVKDVDGMQFVRVNLGDGEVTPWIARPQSLGLTSKPRKGAPAIVGLIGGSRDHPICMIVDAAENRPAGLDDNDVCLYNLSDPQAKIILKGDGSGIEYHAVKHTFFGVAEFKNDLSSDGNISTATGDVTAGLISLKLHIHGPGNTAATTGPAKSL